VPAWSILLCVLAKTLLLRSNLITDTQVVSVNDFITASSEYWARVGPSSKAMVLDPMSALSVATAVVQFVDFASKVISKTYEYRDSADGMLVENREHKTVAASLKSLTEELDKSLQKFELSRKLSKNEIGLREVTMKCHEVAMEMQDAMTKLDRRIGGKSFFLQSFRLALTEHWGKCKIESLQVRLNEARQQVMIHLMVVSM
jgi:hypothetical protein